MCNTPEDLDLNGIDTVAVDIETYDPNLKTKGLGAIRNDGFICGIAVATGKDTAYFPLRHSDTDIDYQRIDKIWQVLNDKIFQNENITKVFHNAMYDVCWIRAVTGMMIKGRIVDTMIAASVIDENRFRYSLDSLSKDYLNEEKYKYDLQQKTLEWSGGTVKDPMTNMHKLPASDRDWETSEYLNLFSSITDAAIMVSTILPLIIIPVTALIQHTSYIAL